MRQSELPLAAAWSIVAALALPVHAQVGEPPQPAASSPFQARTATGPTVSSSYLAGKLPTAPDSVAAYGPDLFGDKASLYNGSLEFEQTDISLPGNSALPVALTRRFSPGREPTVRGQLGDWDLALPRIGGTFSEFGWVTPSGGTNRCTDYTAPPAVNGSGPGGGTGFAPQDYWQGTTIDVPGQGAQELLRRAGNYFGTPTDGSYPNVTRGNWQISCGVGVQNDVGEGFLAVSPDGVRYRFDWIAKRTLTGVRKGNAAIDRTEHFLFATRVTDRFGNYVEYSFDPNNPMRLLGITSSDGRTITLQYADGRLASAFDGSRTFYYAYSPASYGEFTQYNLSAVSQPDGSSWAFNLNGMLHPNYGELGEGADCNLPGVYPSTNLIGSITHPSGATGTFKTQFVAHGKTFVQQACWYVQGTSGPTTGAVWRRLVRSQTLLEKQITGPGMDPMVWSYKYGSDSSWEQCLTCVGQKSVTVTKPDGSIDRHTFGNRWRINDGQLLQLEEGITNGVPLRTTTYRYRDAAGQVFPDRFGTSPLITSDWMAALNRPQDLRVISQQGVNFTWRVNESSDGFEKWARVVDVTKSSSLGFSRTELTRYYDGLHRWAINQVEEVQDAGRVRESYLFDPYTDQPSHKYEFGRLVERYDYHLSNDAQKGLLKNRFDAANRATRFDDYHRGIARQVTHRDLTSERAEVTNLGRIDWYRNAVDTITDYSYDSMGRLAQITYPNETDLTYHPTVIQFERVNAEMYGIAPGHWRQTITTGQGKTERYFDALWRPRLTRTFDATNPTTTSTTGSQIELRYDAAGRKAFESYPLRGLALLDQAATKGRFWLYDSLGRETQMQQDYELPTSRLTTLTDYLGNFQRRVTNPRGHATTFSYQAYDTPSEDRITQVQAPLGVVVQIPRDPWGKPSSITRSGFWAGSPVSATRSYVYESDFQRLCKTIEPETGATVQKYDPAGNVEWRASGLNLPSTSACDQASVPPGSRATFQYDEMDRITTTTYGDGSPSVTRTYWPDGKEKSNSSGQFTWTMDYNNRRLLTRETYAYPVVSPDSYPIERRYNANGDQHRIEYWGGISVDYAPNALGQPMRASGFAESVTWHPNGALSSYTRPGTNPARTFSMQLNARQLPEVWSDTGVMNDRITYDENGNVTGIADNYSGLNTRSMIYDPLDRLTTANGVWGNGSYGYDGLDNMRASTVGTRSLSHRFDDPNTQRLTGLTGSQNVSFGYDVQGNITSRSTGGATLGFVFDVGNRMRRAENVPGVGTIQYTYDGNGRRAWEAHPGNLHRGFAYTQDGKLMIVGDTVNGRIADWYVYLGDRQIGQVNLRSPTEFVHTDYLGSVIARSTVGGVLEATRTRYEPYGRVTSEFQPVGGGFTGHVHDSDTALIQMQQRYYDPIAGRFLSVDPVVTDANTGGSFNRYAYVGNNPYGFTDPTGRSRVGAESSLSRRYEYGDGPAVGSGGERDEENSRAQIIQYQHRVGQLAKDLLERVEQVFELAVGVGGWLKAAKGAAQGLGFARSQLQHGFKHAKDFGVSGSANNKTLSEFSSALQSHVDAAGTRAIQGTYRGNPVTHHLDPGTGLNVIRDSSGNFLSGWKLSPQQLQHVLTTGKLGGG